MTNQEIFDKAVPAVIAQGRPAFIRMEGVCRYRLHRKADDKVRCAIGHLIPDDKYDPDYEAYDVEDVVRNTIGEVQDIEFVRALQEAHDVAAACGSDFVSDFKTRALEVARDYGLDTSCLN